MYHVNLNESHEGASSLMLFLRSTAQGNVGGELLVSELTGFMEFGARTAKPRNPLVPGRLAEAAFGSAGGRLTRRNQEIGIR